MEIIIFKKNEISSELFNNFSFHETTDIDKLKNCEYGNFKDLDYTKGKIDLYKYNENTRRAAAKYFNEYEFVKLLCKKKVISRAYFKLYEIIYYESIIVEKDLDCFFICEAPGGFIECVCDIRRKKNLLTKFTSISSNSIKYDKYIEENNLLYGDITNPNIINSTIIKIKNKFPYGINLITADGGFDVKIFNNQEILTSRLILCEIYLALNTQKIGGMFIIKFFDMFTHNSVIYYLLLCSLYDYVKIIKPKTSRNCNSERYLVCYNFHGIKQKQLLGDLFTTIKQYNLNEINKKENYIILYPYFNFLQFEYLKKKLSSFNNLIVDKQIKTINESIQMVINKNIYFHDLIIRIFLDKNKYTKTEKVIKYKNILNSRIKLCTQFLKLYNININQI